MLKDDRQSYLQEETIEIRDSDDETTKANIQTALKKIAGDACETPVVAIKMRKVYSGTQATTVTLQAAMAQKLFNGGGKIRIGCLGSKHLISPHNALSVGCLGITDSSAKVK